MKNIFLLKIMCLQLFFAGAATTFAQSKEDVRILVVYTKKAKDKYGSAYIKSSIDDHIRNINVAFKNSGINHMVLLVGKEEIDSNEDEKRKFYDIGLPCCDEVAPYNTSQDNFLFFLKSAHKEFVYKDVPNLISTTQADICILLTSELDIGVAGAADRNGYDDKNIIAKGRGNDSSTAYCVIAMNLNLTMAQMANMTVPHEVGHLYGCRHEIAQDATSSTAHGYVLAGKDKDGNYLHDIMAYGKKANTRTTNPIPYFSDPNRTYNGYALGDANSNAVERINNKGYNDLKAGKSIAQDFTINSDLIDKSGEFIEITAKNTITTSSTAAIDVESGGSLILYVPAVTGLTKSIKMKPGFHAEAGSSFLATTTGNWIPGLRTLALSRPDNGTTADLQGLRIRNDEQAVKKVNSNTPLDQASSKVIIYPNPFNDKVSIKYTLDKDQPVNLMFYDIAGKQIGQSIIDTPQTAGEHEFIFDGSALSKGIYIYKLTIDGAINTGKIIKEK